MRKISAYGLFLLVSGLLLAYTCVAQSDTTVKRKKYWPVSADCAQAVPLNIVKKISYGPTVAPVGFGERQEVVARSRNSNAAFEKEHHTAWYLLTMAFDGEIIFDIVPEDSTNDYDFILFPYTDSTACMQLSQGKIKPVRSNIRRNDLANKGVTGLATDAKNELQAQGPGAQFSKSLIVKKDERYMLVLDNVYEGGKGHTLNFHYIKEVNIAGKVEDEAGKPLADVSVTLSDVRGNTVAAAKSDDSGKYTLKATIAENMDFQLTFSDDQHFFATETINTGWLKTPETFTHLRVVLPTLKKGRKYKVGNINFYGDSPEMLPESYGSALALYKLMRKNDQMKIRIEGHVNAPYSNPEIERYQKLSEWRARALYEYLAEKGINKDRMSTIGLSNRFMLFPKAANEREMAANRRVEINVLSTGRESGMAGED